jgi:hypothetical protein
VYVDFFLLYGTATIKEAQNFDGGRSQPDVNLAFSDMQQRDVVGSGEQLYAGRKAERARRECAFVH